jgi:hypothetical protein
VRTYSLVFITIYATSCLVYCRRVYRWADCKCDNAYSLGLYRNHIARYRGFRDRRFNCATILKTTGGCKISSRWISPVHHRCNYSRLTCETHRVIEFLELLIAIQRKNLRWCLVGGGICTFAAQRVHTDQGVGDARGEGRDRRERGCPLVDRIELPPPAGLGDASSIDDRSAGYSGSGEDQRRPRTVRRTNQDVVNHERRF